MALSNVSGPMVVEVSPARWKVLLLIPAIAAIAWWFVSTLFSGNPLWLIDLFF